MQEDWEFEQHFSDDEEDAKKAEGGLRVDMDDQDEAEAELEREMAPPKVRGKGEEERGKEDNREE